MAGLPGAIVYRLNRISYWFGKTVLKVPYIGIENLLLERAFHPEFIQDIDEAALLEELVDAVENPARRKDAEHAVEALNQILSPEVDHTVDRWLLEKMDSQG